VGCLPLIPGARKVGRPLEFMLALATRTTNERRRLPRRTIQCNVNNSLGTPLDFGRNLHPAPHGARLARRAEPREGPGGGAARLKSVFVIEVQPL